MHKYKSSSDMYTESDTPVDRVFMHKMCCTTLDWARGWEMGSCARPWLKLGRDFRGGAALRLTWYVGTRCPLRLARLREGLLHVALIETRGWEMGSCAWPWLKLARDFRGRSSKARVVCWDAMPTKTRATFTNARAMLTRVLSSLARVLPWQCV